MEVSNAGAIILIDGKKALFQLRDKIEGIVYPGYWCIPGGSVDEDSSFLEGAQRELKEETGYISKEPFYFLMDTYQLPDGRIIKRHLFFEDYDGEQEIGCFEGERMEFKLPRELSGEKVYPDHLDFVERAIKLAIIRREG